tara:strand:- start:2754 stop:3041 length:288 start_codon:yes stop_codon:yes gene_type:complete
MPNRNALQRQELREKNLKKEIEESEEIEEKSFESRSSGFIREELRQKDKLIRTNSLTQLHKVPSLTKLQKIPSLTKLHKVPSSNKIKKVPSANKL